MASAPQSRTVTLPVPPKPPSPRRPRWPIAVVWSSCSPCGRSATPRPAPNWDTLRLDLLGERAEAGRGRRPRRVGRLPRGSGEVGLSVDLQKRETLPNSRRLGCVNSPRVRDPPLLGVTTDSESCRQPRDIIRHGPCVHPVDGSQHAPRTGRARRRIMKTSGMIILAAIAALGLSTISTAARARTETERRLPLVDRRRRRRTRHSEAEGSQCFRRPPRRPGAEARLECDVRSAGRRRSGRPVHDDRARASAASGSAAARAPRRTRCSASTRAERCSSFVMTPDATCSPWRSPTTARSAAAM